MFFVTSAGRRSCRAQNDAAGRTFRPFLLCSFDKSAPLLWWSMLTSSDQQHLRAAEGWLELGDHLSAFEELDQVHPDHSIRTEVLKLRWRIYAAAEKWEPAYQLAEGMTRMDALAEDVETFIWRSYAARRMPSGGVALAYELLRDVSGQFVDEPLVPYNLACYACQLGRIPDARGLLHVAFGAAERNATEKFWRRHALEDEDLRPLWNEIKAL